MMFRYYSHEDTIDKRIEWMRLLGVHQPFCTPEMTKTNEYIKKVEPQGYFEPEADRR